MKKLIPIVIFCLAVCVIACIPLRVMSYGFLPPDDALRHSAKVISEKNWDQILVLRPEFKMDSHPGWHAILGAIYRSTGLGQDALVSFSVTFLFILFCMIPIFFMERPEAWLASLLAAVVMAPYIVVRLFLGRPFIFTMSILLVLFFLWPRLKEKKPYAIMAFFTVLFALSTWIHASWYLLALPVLCFFFAREIKVGMRLAICVFTGVIIGASLTGHPYLFLKQTLTHMTLALGNVQAQRLLVTEFQPFSGDAMLVVLILGMLVWRQARGKWNKAVINNPIFVLAITGWALGFVSIRFWSDWGFPAAIFWLAWEFHNALDENMKVTSWRRAIFAFAVSAALFLAITADVNSRWTYNLTTEYLSSSDPKQAEWLPNPGGVIYSDDMGVFYQTFFKNPKAPWRYILGFEPAMMPAEDLAVLRKIHWNYETGKAFEPWVRKMRPEDRLIIRKPSDSKPKITDLEWYYAATNTWIGRLPRK